MDPQMLDATLNMQLTEIRERIDRAAGIAKAAEACAASGNLDKAVEITLDIEQLVYEVNTLLNAVSLMHRTGRT